MASDICDEKNDIISEIKKRIQSTRNIMSGKAYRLVKIHAVTDTHKFTQ